MVELSLFHRKSREACRGQLGHIVTGAPEQAGGGDSLVAGCFFGALFVTGNRRKENGELFEGPGEQGADVLVEEFGILHRGT